MSRQTAAEAIAKNAGELALKYFNNQQNLVIEQKGDQDFVSQADKNVEDCIRLALEKEFPNDSIVGEEGENKSGTSGFTWVIDPIDGTTNFINALPAWCIVLAGVEEGQVQVGIIYDPVHDEMYACTRGQSASLNGTVLPQLKPKNVNEGSIAVGINNRVSIVGAQSVISDILVDGGLFHRNASGALSLAYVAAGRLTGYIEEHMNAWDCLAGQLLIECCGGGIEKQDADQMILSGGRVVTGCPDVFEALVESAERHFVG
ncbi:MAG: inositol monophosphatase family protein [Alphaproteobacteria bacterium]